ncbi:MAG: tetratricopeptide repeat protein [Alphaproteobacteria bacterium]|nr:tetratricopeptide repeat protein [Alphaproteobacteria bacterium]
MHTRRLIAACVLGAAALTACAPAQLPPAQGTTAGGVASKKESVVRIARASAAAGDLGTAVNLYRQALAQDGNDLPLRMELASVLMKAGQAREARDILEEAETQAPDNPDILENLAEAYIYVGNSDEAVKLAESAMKKAPRAKLFGIKGVALDMQDEHDAAQEAYREGLKQFPKDDMLQTNLGMSLILQGHYDEAIKVLLEVAEGRTSFPKARQNLALAYGLKGQWDKAYALGLQDLTKEQAKENIEFYKQFVLGDSTRTLPVSSTELPSATPSPVEEPVLEENVPATKSPKPLIRFDSSSDFLK